MFEVALWQGYSLHLFQFSPLKITQVADVDQFMASFFPEGLDADQDTFTLKVPHGYTDFVFHVCFAALSRRCVYVLDPGDAGMRSLRVGAGETAPRLQPDGTLQPAPGVELFEDHDAGFTATRAPLLARL